MTDTYECRRCGMTDTEQLDSCHGCGAPWPFKPSPARHPGPVLPEPPQAAQSPYGWLADGTTAAGAPGPGVELYRPLAVGCEPVALWLCDPVTGEPVRRVFATRTPAVVWSAFVARKR